MSAKTTRNYETLVILNPSLSEDEINALVDRLQGILTNGGATILDTARWGRRRLAYEIAKKNEGYYVIYYFTLDGSHEVLETIERACRYDENVMRQMTVTVPSKKHGQEVAQLVPAPGYLADFKLEPRAHGFRRRPDYGDRGPRESAPMAPPAAAPAEAAPAEAPAAASEGEKAE